MPTARLPAPRGWAYRALVFLASFLLFQIELIAAKLLLPRFGASASVWTTSLVFFQAALLLGYVAAAWAAPRPGYRWAHLAVVALPALLAFPLRLPSLSLSPALAVAATLALSVGLPYAALSTTSIVAQRWLGRSGLAGARDPYFLYGTSNAGALAALLTYPVLVEPALDVGSQLRVWYAGYALFVLLHLLCLPPAGAADAAPDAPASRAGAGPWLTWLLLAGAPNALLMAATAAVTLDASVPLLWVVPLTVYLLTLVATFAKSPPGDGAITAVSAGALVVALLGLGMVKERTHLELGYVLFHDCVLLVGCLLCHDRLVRSRPSDPGALGSFYLAVSVGGLLGSLLVAVGVPALGQAFAAAYVDYAVAGALLLAAFLVRDRAWLAAFARERPALAGLGAAGALAFAGLGLLAVKAGLPGQLYASRTFYGLYSVRDEGGLRYFRHGNTTHGVESLDPAKRGEPLAYYHRGSPVGQLLALGEPLGEVGVVGLGAGSLAAYARPGERWTFYELDPEVEHVARTWFSYLGGSAGQVSVVPGDARLSLEAAPDRAFDLLVLDAFSSDFVPLHLLDREALALYARKLRPKGRLVFHISSRVFDLIPVMARLAQDGGLSGAYRVGDLGPDDGQFASIWVGLSREPERAKALEQQLGWLPLSSRAPARPGRVWTDDYVNLFDALGG